MSQREAHKTSQLCAREEPSGKAHLFESSLNNAFGSGIGRNQGLLASLGQARLMVQELILKQLKI